MLSPSQMRIVQADDKHILVLAGPGSGKTRVITERIFYLFDNSLIEEPFGLLAVTFTRAAAGEMRDRLRSAGFRDWDRITIGTFHSLGRYFLSCYGGDIGIREDFDILDVQLQRSILQQLNQKHGVNMSYWDTRRRISSLKKRDIYPDASDLMDKGIIDESFANLYVDYQRILGDGNLLDFDDLITLSLRLLRESDTPRRVYTTFYQYIVVDEFQDTDTQQFRLIWGLARYAKLGSIIVADDDQSIYGFRGARKTNVFEIATRLQSQVYYLEENFRSDQVIVQAALSLINEPNTAMGKELKSVSTEKGVVYHQSFLNPMEEAKSVAACIRLLKDEVPDWGEIAVIARSRHRLKWLGAQLLDIPWFDREQLGFEPSWETDLGLAAIQLACSVDSSIAIHNLMSVIENAGLFLRVDCEDALEMALEIRKLICEGLPKPLGLQEAACVFDCINLEVIIHRCSDSNNDTKRRLDNISTLIEDIMSQARMCSLDLQGTLERLAGHNAVQILTAHKSKGLEFDHVFIMGLEDDILPDYRSTTDDEMAEERRILYVSLTRARKAVYLSNASEREMPWGDVQPKMPSRFISAIPQYLLTPWPTIG
jgi:DNA helicase-2/ATP-dependent DNA helicase PcrA